MAKSKQSKIEEVAALAASLKESKGIAIATMDGVTIADSEELRRDMHGKNVKLRFIKQSLMELACKDAGLEVDPATFAGTISIATSDEDEVTPAKLIHNFAKERELVSLIGGYLEGEFMSGERMQALAVLPSKDQLRAQVVGTLAAPISGLANVMAGNLRGLVQVLKAAQDKRAA